jgi:hypothetical protein
MNFKKKNGIKGKIIFLLSLTNLFRKEKSKTIKLSILKKLFCYFNGFLSESYIIYDFLKNNSKYYLSDFERFVKAGNINYSYRHLIDNKLFFNMVFLDCKFLINAISYIENGRIFNINSNYHFSSIETLMKYGRHKSSLVFKPPKGGGGRGIFFFPDMNSTISEIDLKKTLGNGNYLIFNKFEQKGFSNEIYPNSLNTIRILTMYDPYKNMPFIAAAVHRFGTKKSVFVDNWTSGGISANIDILTGKLSKAVQYPFDSELKFFSKHPDTNSQIEGKIIPFWDKIKKKSLYLANRIAFIPYVGWDFVISGEELFLLEANSNSDINLLQVHSPLLIDRRVVEFYKYYGVI